MAIFNDGRKVIDVNPNPALKFVGLAVGAFIVVILLFSSVSRVESGHVGVLTLVCSRCSVV